MNTPAEMQFSSDATHRTVSLVLGAGAAVWGVAVAIAAASGALAAIWRPAIAALAALGVAVPTMIYFAVPAIQAWADRVGLTAITALHVWRVPASLLFFWYGWKGELPPVFCILAGVGDLAAGVWAYAVTRRPGASLDAYRRMHRFGLADFVVAVGTGLTFTLLGDPRMSPITVLPMALIPLFAVGVLGASHLIAFDLLRHRAVRLKLRTASVAGAELRL